MMWNWLASGLACGATLMLYDGSPFPFRYWIRMPALWKMHLGAPVACQTLQTKYPDVWKPLRNHFDASRRVWNGE